MERSLSNSLHVGNEAVRVLQTLYRARGVSRDNIFSQCSVTEQNYSILAGILVCYRLLDLPFLLSGENQVEVAHDFRLSVRPSSQVCPSPLNVRTL